MLLCATRICSCMWLDWLNALSHVGHLYGFSPVWTLVWARKCACWLNALLHVPQMYGFSPVWTLMWLYKPKAILNAFSHMWHLYGFSSLWILLCTTSAPDVVHRLPQTLHSNGFSPEWIRRCSVNAWFVWHFFPHSLHLYLLLWIFICWFSWVWDVKCFSHWVQEYKLFPLCMLRWFSNPPFAENRLSQTVQKYAFGLALRWCLVTLSLLPGWNSTPALNIQHDTVEKQEIHTELSKLPRVATEHNKILRS